MNTALAPSLGSTVQTFNQAITPKVITDGLWGWGASGLKTIKDTVTAVAPKLLSTNNTQFWGLGIKAAGLALAAYSGITAVSGVYSASKDLAGSPSFDTATGSLVGSALDVTAAGTALAMAFGKTNAVIPAAAYLTAGLFKEYENLATGRSKLYGIPALSLLLKYQANEGNWNAQGTTKLQESYDPFIKGDNWMRKNLLGFNDYLLRPTEGDEWKKLHDISNGNLEIANRSRMTL